MVASGEPVGYCYYYCYLSSDDVGIFLSPISISHTSQRALNVELDIVSPILRFCPVCPSNAGSVCKRMDKSLHFLTFC